MTEKIVHNPTGDARVFDSRGRLIGPHQNRAADPADPVTARLVSGHEVAAVRRSDRAGELPPIPVPPAAVQEREFGRPPLNAARDRWVEYAVQLGYDGEELEGLTRTEIIELVDSGEEAAESDSESPAEDPPHKDTGEGGRDAENAVESSQDDEEATATSGAETDTDKETE